MRGRRFYGSCGTKDFEEAKAVESQARVEAKSAPQAHGKFTLSEALGTYWTDICEQQSSARTAESQAKKILEVIPGSTRIDRLSNQDVMRFVRTRRAEVSNATVNRHLQFLARALRHMENFYGATISELNFKAAASKEPKERIRELTYDEQNRLFSYLREDLHPLVKFALMTGARQATILGLCWNDIKHEKNRIDFRLKGGGELKFPMNGEIRALISALPKSSQIEHRKYVFTYLTDDKENPERRRIRQNSHLFVDFRDALRKAEIEDFRFHDLRHTFATRMLRSTGNLKLVSRLLGHTSIETTMRYAHVLDADLADAMDDFSMFQNAESRNFSRSL
ncbi:tyrosine-type recombinase/integrase [Epibacterium sp. Ofav1-8]|uniref:tyrosine-type recombinase/integrase n=1 Tax=Epibacterium sp. Ofav1-8 TaxID=2917735 RepID=UPI00351D4105